MVTLQTVSTALVPTSSEAARRVTGPNYDEFQGDEEIVQLVARQPESILRVTMPHCDVAVGAATLAEGSDEALQRGAKNLARLRACSLMREDNDVLWVYEIVGPGMPAPQIGIGGMALTAAIRDAGNPGGDIIRNEEIREAKAQGRADLIARTSAIIGVVNLALEDTDRALTSALEEHANRYPCDYEVADESQHRHRVWLVRDVTEVARFQELIAAEPHAFVADGNHRSAAAAMSGGESFLTVFFPIERMQIAPYHRLVAGDDSESLVEKLEEHFDVNERGDRAEYQPREVHEIGLYRAGSWWTLRPKPGSFDPGDAAADIDADIVQTHIFAGALGIDDARDSRLTYVGGDRGTAYLKEQVDVGRHTLAVSLAAVSKEQFMEVCRQNRLMPPKSTWFSPKVRSGLLTALL